MKVSIHTKHVLAVSRALDIGDNVFNEYWQLVIVIVFDIVYCNGNPLLDYALSDRLKILGSVVKERRGYLNLLPREEKSTFQDIVDALDRAMSLRLAWFSNTLTSMVLNSFFLADKRALSSRILDPSMNQDRGTKLGSSWSQNTLIVWTIIATCWSWVCFFTIARQNVSHIHNEFQALLTALGDVEIALVNFYAQ